MGTFREDNYLELVPGSWADENQETAYEIAEYQYENMKDWKHYTPFSGAILVIGAFGEIKFEQVSGLPRYEPHSRHPDGGIDFQSPIGNIDIKTARAAPFLAVPPEKNFDLIFVLAKFNLSNVYFVGWEYGHIVKQAEIGRLRGPKARRLNHLVPREELRRMDELYPQVCVEGGQWFERKKLQSLPPDPVQEKQKPKQLSLFF